MASLRNADTRLRSDEEHQHLGSWKRIESAVSRYNDSLGDVTVRLNVALDFRRSADADTTGVLLDSLVALVQNAANARGAGAPPVEVDITIRRDRSRANADASLILVVEDNAGGEPVAEDDWGKGLWSCNELATSRGGNFSLERGARGLRAVLRIPYLSSGTGGYRARSYTASYERGVREALRALRYATAAQAAFLAVHRRAALRRDVVAVGLLVGLGELAERFPPRTRDLSQAALCVAAMSTFDGCDRPPLGGWSAVMAASCSTRGRTARAHAAAALGFVFSTARAGDERFRNALVVTAVDRTFPLLGAAAGAFVSRGQQRLEADETRLGSEAWRRRLFLDLVRPEITDHHFLQPVQRAIRASAPGALDAFEESPLGEKLALVRKDMVAAQRHLVELLEAADPLLSLQHQLARLLQPAPVAVTGSRPKLEVPQQGHELDSAGYRIALVGLGQAVAEAVRSHLPPTVLGRRRLKRLRLEVRPGETLTRVDIVQVPFEAPREDRTRATLDAASRDAGGRAESSSSNRHTVFVDNSALS
jgi:hypothetical protein